MNGEESNPDVAPRNVFSLHHRPSPVLVRHVYATFGNKFSEHLHQNKFFTSDSLHFAQQNVTWQNRLLRSGSQEMTVKWNSRKFKIEAYTLAQSGFKLQNFRGETLKLKSDLGSSLGKLAGPSPWLGGPNWARPSQGDIHRPILAGPNTILVLAASANSTYLDSRV